MKLKIEEITSAVAKITDLVSGDKVVPGVLLDINGSTVKVRYGDGHKAFSETITAEQEDGDVQGQIVVDYSRLVEVLNKCQPSGIIVVDYITFRYPADKVIEVMAQQKCLVQGETGEEEYKVLAEKTMRLNWAEVTSSMKTAILGRMDYDKMFNANIVDTWESDELIEMLSRTSTEKSRVIYMSPNIQKAFVSNIAHVTAVPVSPLDVTAMDIELLREELDGEGRANEFDTEKAKLYKRLKYPATISTIVAKQICGILTKTGKGIKVLSHAEDGYLSIFTEDERVGISIAMAEGSKAQTNQFEKFSSISYDSYQLNFLREFLVDAIKSAVASTSSEKLTFGFTKNENMEQVLTLAVLNSNASIDDTYKVVVEDCIDSLGNLDEQQMKISLKVFDSMLAQLKSDVVGLDIKLMEDGSACIRLAEVNRDKAVTEYYDARKRLGLTDVEPTPMAEKLNYREKTLETVQYTLVAK